MILASTSYLLLTFALASVANANKVEESTIASLKQICNHGTEHIPITRVDEVKEILQAFKENSNLCPIYYHYSISQLETILAEDVLENVCSRQTYDKIRSYHSRFISIYTPEASKQAILANKEKGTDDIPESIRRFFILFVRQISGMCKQNLVARFEAEVLPNSEYLITPNEFRSMEVLRERVRNLVGTDFHKEPHHIDQVITSSVDLSDEYKLHVILKDSSHTLKQLENVCMGKLKPVYEELFLPTIRLINLGYDEDSISHDETKILNSNKEYRKWYTIIETCGQFRYINSIVHKDSFKDKPDESIEILVVKPEEFQQLVADVEVSMANKLEIRNFEHRAMKLNELSQLSPAEARSAIANFDSTIKRLIRLRTSELSIEFHKFLTHFQKWKQQWKNGDELTGLGKVKSWFSQCAGQLGVVGYIALFLMVLLIV